MGWQYLLVLSTISHATHRVTLTIKGCHLIKLALFHKVIVVQSGTTLFLSPVKYVLTLVKEVKDT